MESKDGDTLPPAASPSSSQPVPPVGSPYDFDQADYTALAALPELGDLASLFPGIDSTALQAEAILSSISANRLLPRQAASRNGFAALFYARRTPAPLLDCQEMFGTRTMMKLPPLKLHDASSVSLWRWAMSLQVYASRPSTSKRRASEELPAGAAKEARMAPHGQPYSPASAEFQIPLTRVSSPLSGILAYPGPAGAPALELAEALPAPPTLAHHLFGPRSLIGDHIAAGRSIPAKDAGLLSDAHPPFLRAFARGIYRDTEVYASFQFQYARRGGSIDGEILNPTSRSPTSRTSPLTAEDLEIVHLGPLQAIGACFWPQRAAMFRNFAGIIRHIARFGSPIQAARIDHAIRSDCETSGAPWDGPFSAALWFKIMFIMIGSSHQCFNCSGSHRAEDCSFFGLMPPRPAFQNQRAPHPDRQYAYLSRGHQLPDSGADFATPHRARGPGKPKDSHQRKAP